MTMIEARPGITVSDKMTEALRNQDKLQRRIRFEQELKTPSGISILPKLTEKARETGQPTIIGPDHPDLDKIPHIYGDQVVYGGKTLIIGGFGVHVIPSYEKSR